MDPASAWAALLAGNRRFIEGRPEHPNQDLGRRTQTAAGQDPFAVIFGCMDSRVSAEIVFDRGLGDLAVVRTAGHVLDGSVLGSLEFGVVELGAPLIVVLGHDQCGAAGATLRAHHTGTVPGGFLRDVVERVWPSLLTARRGEPGAEVSVDELSEQHVRYTVQAIVERSSLIADAVAEGRCAVVGAGYRLVEGRVRQFAAIGEIPAGEVG